MTAGTKTRSEPRLSEVARHIVRPAGIVGTDWRPVEGKLRTLGVHFQRWQEGAARLILAKNAAGQYAAGVGGAVLSIPRQVGKTFLIGALVFALCLLRRGTTVIWTAHRVRTAQEVFRAMQGFARRKAVAPYVKAIIRGAGSEAIEFTNGSRILFGARATGFGRGFAKVAILVFDECQILDEDTLDDMIPATNRATNPLVIFTGTPPKPGDGGETFARFRRDALAGESDDVLYVELSADPDTDPTKWPKGYVDWEQVEKANPSFPDLTPKSAILRMLRLIGLTSFRREGLGIWDADTGPKRAIKSAKWSALHTDEPPTDGRDVLAVKFNLDGDRVSAAIARRTADDLTHVEVLGVWPLAEGSRLLTSWIVADRANLAAVVIDGKAAQAAFIAELRRRRVPARLIVEPNVGQVIEAHASMMAAVENDTMTHNGQPGLAAAVAVATKRKIGVTGGWGWEAIGDGDVLPLESATFALWGAETTKRRPGRKMRGVVS